MCICVCMHVYYSCGALDWHCVSAHRCLLPIGWDRVSHWTRTLSHWPECAGLASSKDPSASASHIGRIIGAHHHTTFFLMCLLRLWTQTSPPTRQILHHLNSLPLAQEDQLSPKEDPVASAEMLVLSPSCCILVGRRDVCQNAWGVLLFTLDQHCPALLPDLRPPKHLSTY